MTLATASFICAGCRGMLGGWLLLAATLTGAQTCTFRTAGGPLNFPSLDASSAVTVTASMQIGVRCTPAAVTPAWTFSGANGSAPLRMKHSTQNAYIPYVVTTSLISSNGANEQWRVTGTILGANYQNARIGTYSDVLTATVTP